MQIKLNIFTSGGYFAGEDINDYFDKFLNVQPPPLIYPLHPFCELPAWLQNCQSASQSIILLSSV